MLYKTTRNIQDPVTVQHVLTGNRGEDGGLYLPLHFPNYTEEERKRFCCLSFNQRMAEILNLFFSTKLTGWDLDFSTGRYPVRLEEFPHRIFLAECWHNLPCPENHDISPESASADLCADGRCRLLGENCSANGSLSRNFWRKPANR